VQQGPNTENGPNEADQRRNMIRVLARGWRLLGAPGHAIDRRRRHGSHARLKDSLLGTQPSPAENDPWARFSGAMARQAVEEALGVLPPDQLEMVGLAYFEGLTNQAIAERTGVSVPTVRRRLRTALARMSAYLNERGGGTWALAPLVARLATDHRRPGKHLAQLVAGTFVAATVVTAGGHAAMSQIRLHPTPATPSVRQDQVQATAGERSAPAGSTMAANALPAAVQPATDSVSAPVDTLPDVTAVAGGLTTTVEPAVGSVLRTAGHPSTQILPPKPGVPALP
jgi:RNA polymerase sigma factor (sigma-70 family)